MKKYGRVEAIKVTAITCDRCGATRADQSEIQEYWCHSDVGGYNSVFGDQLRVELDLCQYCALELFSAWVRTTNTLVQPEELEALLHDDEETGEAKAPQIVWHEHYWSKRGKELIDTDDDAPGTVGRFDACENDAGEIYVYGAETKEVFQYCHSREEAIAVAKQQCLLID